MHLWVHVDTFPKGLHDARLLPWQVNWYHDDKGQSTVKELSKGYTLRVRSLTTRLVAIGVE